MNTKQAENGLLQELLREMKNIKNDLNEFRSETECKLEEIERFQQRADAGIARAENRLEEIERFQQRADAGIARAEKQINEFRFETESKFREISKINRRLKDIERDQRADAGIARAVQAQAMKFEPIPYELEGNSFIEEIKDYY